MFWYKESIEEVFTTLSASQDGLSTSEAAIRIVKYGENKLEFRSKPIWKIILEPFSNIFVIVLLVAMIISWLSNEIVDATIISSIILINAIIFYTQQYTTSRVLRNLKNQNIQKNTVLRDGTFVKVSSILLVPGDIIQLQEGERVPADARIIKAEALEVNESSLTGESIPVYKRPGQFEDNKAIFERTNLLFQGTYIVAGTAEAIIVATANSTEFGKIAALSVQEKSKSPLEEKVNKLISLIIKVIGVVAVIVFTLAVIRDIPSGEALRFALSLTVSAVPEGLPIALTVIIVLGMRRLARKKALVRNFQAIEDIGLVTTIATDKTGTLTKNHLSIAEYWSNNQSIKLEEIVGKTIDMTQSHHDPLDIAISEAFKYKSVVSKYYPFDMSLRMSGAYVAEEKYIYIKGAPEHILKNSNVSVTDRTKAESKMHELAAEGYRVIAIARYKTTIALESLKKISMQHTEFLGFISLADELRNEAAPAVRLAHEAGIKVLLISGDHYETAYNIAKKVGIAKHPDQVISGENLPKDQRVLAQTVAQKTVFARILPEDKFRILQALKKTEITTMTGDGVNDVPAINNAHVGIAMGSGSDIARDASGIVLLNDNFATIVTAVAESRKIFDNIKKMLFYLLSTSLGEVMTMIGALLFGLPLPVTAIQILWINLVTDTAMVIPLGLEPEEQDIMQRPPRRPKDPILQKVLITRMITVASAMAVVTLITVYILSNRGYSTEYIQTIAFTALIAAQWMNAFNARSESQSSLKRLTIFNPGMLVGLTIGFSLQMLVLFGPLGSYFNIQKVPLMSLLIPSIIMVLVVFIVSEVHKLITNKNKTNKNLTTVI
jgi:Ca2+-transporting ATPase